MFKFLRRFVVIALSFFAVLFLIMTFTAEAAPTSSATNTLTTSSTSVPHEMTNAKALVLGAVEGLTEFLPISSTGHLELANNLLGIGKTKATRDAADSYTIVIQAGAILAVLVLYFGRVREILLGLIGKSARGRRLLISLILSFLPAAILGFLFEKSIKAHLFGLGPIAGAWIVGGIVIIAWVRSRRYRASHAHSTDAHYNKTATANVTATTVPTAPIASADTLYRVTHTHALIIGLAQALALWPGTSRSLVTILAAVLLGMPMIAAVEYAFLLGLLTLGAATLYEGAKNGSEILHVFGWSASVLGFVAAFVFAALSVKWMVHYLQRRSFALFGWYRLVLGIGTAIALLIW